ncbi:amidase [Bradyrhizobium guangdongense]|uniref:amidase n=1 Tax=Bradyrhizobium guangdongense TaxID=1325090 RepID=UPI00164304BC|nr:amidase family protein [Bradyrhizobium guangdongense]
MTNASRERVTLVQAEPAPSDPCALPAHELAAGIAQGTITAREAVEAHIARIERVNGALNAVVAKRYDDARAEANVIDQRRARGEALPPLAGVPMTVKECLDLAGTVSTFGIPSRAAARATRDDPYVARLRAAGAIVVAKTNVAQLLIFTETDNPLYGRTNNPWNVERSSGGSSGGEGAIVAAGGAALGLGTDIGGSVRIPAAFCGIASLRPTAGRCPDLGRGSVPFGQQAVASQVGPIARSVDDLALALTAINGGHGLDHQAVVPLGDHRDIDVKGLRVAVLADDGVMTPSPAIQRGLRAAADMLKAAGAQIVPCALPPCAEAMRIWLACITADRGAGMRATSRGGKLDARAALMLRLSGMPPALRMMVARLLTAIGQKGLGGNMRLFADGTAAGYWRAVEDQAAYRAAFASVLDGVAGGPVDLVLMPAYGVPAVRHGASANMPVAGSYSLLAPVLGYPAGIVPVTRVAAGEDLGRGKSSDLVQKTASEADIGSAGLPVAVQLMGRPWRDDVVLAAMRAIEQAARTRPDYPATPKV